MYTFIKIAIIYGEISRRKKALLPNEMIFFNRVIFTRAKTQQYNVVCNVGL